MKTLVCCFLLLTVAGAALATPTEIKLDGSYPIRFQGVGLDLSCFSNVRAFFTAGRGSGPVTPNGFSMSACSYDAGADILMNPNSSAYPTYPLQGIYGLKFSIRNSIGSVTGHGIDSQQISEWGGDTGVWEDASGNYTYGLGATGYIVDGSPSPFYVTLNSFYGFNGHVWGQIYTGGGVAIFAPEPASWSLLFLSVTLLLLRRKRLAAIIN